MRYWFRLYKRYYGPLQPLNYLSWESQVVSVAFVEAVHASNFLSVPHFWRTDLKAGALNKAFPTFGARQFGPPLLKCFWPLWADALRVYFCAERLRSFISRYFVLVVAMFQRRISAVQRAQLSASIGRCLCQSKSWTNFHSGRQLLFGVDVQLRN